MPCPLAGHSSRARWSGMAVPAAAGRTLDSERLIRKFLDSYWPDFAWRRRGKSVVQRFPQAFQCSGALAVRTDRDLYPELGAGPDAARRQLSSLLAVAVSEHRARFRCTDEKDGATRHPGSFPSC